MAAGSPVATILSPMWRFVQPGQTEPAVRELYVVSRGIASNGVQIDVEDDIGADAWVDCREAAANFLDAE